MDFRNLCQKMNMDGVKAKLPTMPQLQFPKALPKLKSRKIFRSLNNDISEREKNASPRSQAFAQQQQQQSSLAPPIPPATFINHTPTRISTISSLMHEQGDYNQGVNAAGNTYCSAFSVDDDYPSPRQRPCEAGTPGVSNLLPNSPGRTNAVDAGGTENRNVHMSITEKLQKGYRDISEFRMKYIFAKKTVVRKDEIQVSDYVLQYDEERRREQLEEERHDKKIADNYNIRFTLSNSRQNTLESDDVADTTMQTPPMKRTTERQAPMPPVKRATTTVRAGAHEPSGDESDMETTPPAFKPGIAATRFSRVRSPPLKMDSIDDEESSPPVRNLTTSRSSGLNEPATTKSTSKLSGNPHMRRLMSYLSLQEESSKPAAEKGSNEKASSPIALKKKPLGGSTVTFEQDTTANTEHRPLEAIKQNVKLFQKFIKNMRTETAPNTDNEYEEGAAAVVDVPERKTTHRDGQRFKSTKDATNKPKDSTGLGRKLKTWKKSFKNNTAEADKSCDEGSPDKKTQEKRSDKLIKKLKNMGSRMSTTSKSEPEDEWVGGQTSQDLNSTQKKTQHMTSNIDDNYRKDREESMKKVTYTQNDSDSEDDGPERQIGAANQRHKHQSMTEVNKDNVQQEYLDSSSEDEVQNDVQFSENSKIPPAINARRRCLNSEYEYYNEQNEIEQINTDYAKRHSELYGASTLTAWTTKPILCQESLDSDTESEFPRVLIHQDHSDAFESTLIIAVTRPASTTLSPQIDEIITETHMLKSHSVSPKPLADAKEWLPNEQIISSFLASNINTKQDVIVRDASLPKSICSSPGNNNNDSEQNINQEKDDPWLTQSDGAQVQRLKKTKTIDIFETNLRNGGARTAFEDFDDELRYEPVVKIEHDRSEVCDTTEDDNSSRLSNASMQTVNENKTLTTTNIFSNNQSSSRESLVAHISEDCSGSTDEGHYDEDDDECFDSDCPPSTAPPKPPSSSPSPVSELQMSLNESASKFSTAVTTVDLTAKECEDIPLPPLRISKPPLPIPLSKPPELPSSMTRLARPLVKTASLRLAYNEQIKPDDIGKVNKLISRFETPGKKCRERPRIISRRMQSQDSEECSDYEIEKNNNAMSLGFDVYDEKPEPKFTQVTETTTQVVKSNSMPPVTLTATEVVNNTRRHTKTATIPEIITTRDNSNDNHNVNQETIHSTSTVDQHGTDNNKSSALSLDRKNSNCSRSEYGSPLAYSLSWRRSYETTPVPERKQQQMELLQQHQRHTRYKRRSMTKDDDNFYSFDSDEENSYYSISPSDSSRYVVEI